MKKLTEFEIKKILELHKKWLNGQKGGKRVNLQGANLQGANLQEANLWKANLWKANLQEVNLEGANLQGANLRGANLRGANLDFSSFPLWCGSFEIKDDGRLAKQLAYHICRLDCSDPKFKHIKSLLKDFANGFHRADECGQIE